MAWPAVIIAPIPLALTLTGMPLLNITIEMPLARDMADGRA